MSVAHILYLLKEYIILAIFIVLLFLFFYKIVYKKIMKGQKEIKTKKLITILIFISYIVIVFGATFLSRGNAYEGAVNLSLFSSYKEAYIIGKISAWRNIIVNIMLFIPMGFLLPLLTPKLKKCLCKKNFRYSVKMKKLFSTPLKFKKNGLVNWFR